MSRERIQLDVIVSLTEYEGYSGPIIADHPDDMAVKHAKIKNHQNAVLNSLSHSQFKLKHQYDNFSGFAGSVSRDGLNALLSMPEVELIEEDIIVETHLNEGISLMNAMAASSTYDGTGISIAIVDTGIDYNHSKLGGPGFPNAKVIGGYDYGGDSSDISDVDPDDDPMDCRGHGTKVAGIAAGTVSTGTGSYIGGVAANAKLYALKVTPGCEYKAKYADIKAAWDWIITHKNDDPDNPILIVNTSIGGTKIDDSAYTSVCDALHPNMAEAADKLVANGITLFTSSGNNGFLNGMQAPACLSNTISVGAVYDANIGRYDTGCTDTTTKPDQVTCYSNSASFLDILAPSHNAYTTAVGGGYIPDFGGTSAASPYAAGAGAVLQSYAIATTGSPYTPAELKAAIVNNGDSVTDTRNSIPKPRVNVGNVIDLVVDAGPDITIESDDINTINIIGTVTDSNPGATCLWKNEHGYQLTDIMDVEENDGKCPLDISRLFYSFVYGPNTLTLSVMNDGDIATDEMVLTIVNSLVVDAGPDITISNADIDTTTIEGTITNSIPGAKCAWENEDGWQLTFIMDVGLNGECPLDLGSAFYPFDDGPNTLTLSVMNDGDIATDEMVLTIVNSLVVDAGPDITIESADIDTTTIEGTITNSNPGAKCAWENEDGWQLTFIMDVGPSGECPLDLGNAFYPFVEGPNTLTLSVMNDGDIATDEMVLTVN